MNNEPLQERRAATTTAVFSLHVVWQAAVASTITPLNLNRGRLLSFPRACVLCRLDLDLGLTPSDPETSPVESFSSRGPCFVNGETRAKPTTTAADGVTTSNEGKPVTRDRNPPPFRYILHALPWVWHALHLLRMILLWCSREASTRGSTPERPPAVCVCVCLCLGHVYVTPSDAV